MEIINLNGYNMTNACLIGCKTWEPCLKNSYL